MATLAVDRVGDGPREVWFLHGILGSGRNWRSFVRTLAKDLPDVCFVLPDLRNHGRTGPLPGPATLASAAQDLFALGTPDAVVGHSFGGKVALEYARAGGPVRVVWALDAVPVAVPGGDADSDVADVLRALQGTPTPAADRRDVRQALDDAGLSRTLVDWLLTSLVQRDDGWRWVFDIAGIQTMMESYFHADYAGFLASADRPEVRLVRAGRSDRWTPDVLARLPASARVDVLPDAGHWVHVDDPEGLRALLLPTLQAPR